MSFTAASAFLNALGWALLNSVWQFAVCLLLYNAFTIVASKRLAAAARHTVAIALLFTGGIIFIIELLVKYFSDTQQLQLPLHFNIAVPATYNIVERAAHYLDMLMPYWSLLYLVCIAVLVVKFCLFVRQADRLRNTGLTKINASWRLYLQQASTQLGIQKTVNVFLSVHIDTPQVIGFLKPVILIPAACLVNLSTEQLEAVLLHELVHIKRNDYLLNLLVALLEILFFFNPFLKQLTAIVRQEREYSCDDTVIHFQYAPGNYAAALLALEKNRLAPVMYGIAASGKNQKQLLTRIERIVGIHPKQDNYYGLGAGLLVLLLACMGALQLMQPNAGTATEPRNFIASNRHLTIQYGPESRRAFALLSLNTANPASTGPVQKQKHPFATDRLKPEGTINTVLSTQTWPADEENEDAIDIVSVSDKAPIDFSFSPGPAAATETVDIPDATTSPYVPNNSFTFQLTQDTIAPRKKGETYQERKAREALLQTQKAMASIDWKRMEKSLKYNRQELTKLKKELVAQLQNLNWQKINSAVQQEFTQERLEALQDAVKQDVVIKQYQQSEAYTEALRRQLTEQQQVIKSSDERLQENIKDIKVQQEKLQQEMKKRRIIYL